MTRGCSICGNGPALKAICCGQKLCQFHEVKHDCPRAAELLATPLKKWRAENAPEDALMFQVIAALELMPELEFVWQARKRGGFKARDGAASVPDVLAYARGDARLVGIETKRNHRDGCPCENCEGQREWGARLVGQGGVYVANVRSVAAALDGVRLGLAIARGRPLHHPACPMQSPYGIRCTCETRM